MPKRKQAVATTIDSPPAAPIITTKEPESTLPGSLHFPLLVFLSLTLSATLYTVASGFTAGDLSSVSRKLDDWWEVGGLIGWKAAELAVGWWGGYDRMLLVAVLRIWGRKLTEL